MKGLSTIFICLAFVCSALTHAAATPGRLKGGEQYVLPHWFKPSFLDFRRDLDEARQRKRHVMVFLHLDDCPYCARMLGESFASGDHYRQYKSISACNAARRQELLKQGIDIDYSE